MRYPLPCGMTIDHRCCLSQSIYHIQIGLNAGLPLPSVLAHPQLPFPRIPKPIGILPDKRSPPHPVSKSYTKNVIIGVYLMSVLS